MGKKREYWMCGLVVEYLPSIHEALGSVPAQHKPILTMHTHNPALQRSHKRSGAKVIFSYIVSPRPGYDT